MINPLISGKMITFPSAFRTSLCLYSFFLLAISCLGAEALNLKLPTKNTALHEGRPQDYYMYTYRSFEGKSSKPYTAGKYGYTRNLKRYSGGIIATRFHEGIDIKPAGRDKSNRPTDIVTSIAVGKVVYCNSSASMSNYGKYVVVQHDWGSGPFYSLYAHLASVSCAPGQKVNAGSALGKMGYTGVGINIERAHLHLELNIMLSDRFAQWHSSIYQSANHHGKHNGINLSGLDIAGLLITHKNNPRVDLPAFIKNQQAYYKVTVPRKGDLQLASRYPWIKQGDHRTSSPSWEISFSSSAFPLAIKPSHRQVSSPTVTYVQESSTYHSYRSRGMLSGSGKQAALSTTGKRHIALITGTH